jgi:hypothetical protein
VELVQYAYFKKVGLDLLFLLPASFPIWWIVALGHLVVGLAYFSLFARLVIILNFN